jgi:hypothetical protein
LIPRKFTKKGRRSQDVETLPKGKSEGEEDEDDYDEFEKPNIAEMEEEKVRGPPCHSVEVRWLVLCVVSFDIHRERHVSHK